MADKKAAFASRTFKKDKNAWAVLTLFALGVFWGMEQWGKTDRIVLRSWKGSVSNQAILTILEFDRVVLNKIKDHIDREEFRKQLQALKEDGYQAVSVIDIYNFYYEAKKLPEKSVLLMFANAYLETYTAVDPILREMQWPAAMTVITETVANRETFFLYWDRLRRMVNSGVWDLISGGHRKRGGMTNADTTTLQRILPEKLWFGREDRNETPKELSKKIIADYKISKALIEANIPGYKLLTHSPVFDNAYNYIQKSGQMKSMGAARKSIYPLGFRNSFVGVNDKSSDPFRLRRLRVKPDWKPETLLVLMNKGVQAVTGANTTEAESIWFQEDGELVATSTDQKMGLGQKLRLVGTPKAEQGIRIHGAPGAGIFFPEGNNSGNWVLEADIRLDRGEFWIRQNSSKTGAGWRVGGNLENMNVQIRVANGQYENLAGSKAGIALAVWQHLRLIKRGKGIIVDWNGETLWNYPVYMQGELNGDIVFQVWSREGEASLSVADAKISFFPDDIRWLENYPEEKDIQLLIKHAEKVSAVTTVTHEVQEGQTEPVPFDRDLFQIISHRYGWNFVPTIKVLPRKKLSGKLESEYERKNGNGDTETLLTNPIKQWVQQNHWTHVHLDLSLLARERNDEQTSRFAELKNELEKLNCRLLVTTDGRPDVSQSLKFKLPLLRNDSKSKWLVAERSR